MRPRLLLLDDNLAWQQFVTQALASRPLDLQICHSVRSALALLTEAPVNLLITDLGSPISCNHELLKALQAQPQPGASAGLLVCSEAEPEMLAQTMAGWASWRFMRKSCSPAQLQACVQEVLTDAGQRQALAHHFGGNTALYQSFLQSCQAQFPADLVTGDQACERQDGPALHHLAHSLKSVLLILGFWAAGEKAADLELLLAQGLEQGQPWPGEATSAWAELRAHLLGCAIVAWPQEGPNSPS
ncbi:Hpt domain-containing protein [Roseateles sp.]|uniref:response regulator n=1 Tax=Roseateles sp. TaxID=1971397 RepID=UPI003BA74268